MKVTSLLLLLPLAVISGFGQDIRYNFDRSADFARYKTYKWVNVKDAVPLDQLSDQQLTSAVDAELAKKGLARTDGENADLLIDDQFAINQEKQFNSYSSDFGYGPGWGSGWYGGGMGSSVTTGQTYTIHIGEVGQIGRAHV